MSSRQFSSNSLNNFGSGRSMSTYRGGAGGGGGDGGQGGRGLSFSSGLQGNEKQAMQSLNERLANFMNKVGNLEKANAELELKIKELLKGKGAQDSDYESYYGIIADLRAKIHNQIMENAQISLEIDNARLAADDFKTKLDNETTLRTTVEADIDNLHGLRDEYTMATSSMKGELEALQDELDFLKKNHAEEVAALKAQISGSSMSVEVDAQQGPNIMQMLDEMRKRYEADIERNRAEAEQAFQLQAEQVQQVAVQQNQAAMSSKNEVTEMRQSMQVLQSELATLRGQIPSLEDTLDDTRCRKQRELESYLNRLEQLEGDLASARGDINGQKCDYAKLLDEKMQLEAEIETYRRLLDGGGSGVEMSPSSSSSSKGMRSGSGGTGSGSGGTGSGSGGTGSGSGGLSLKTGGLSLGSGGLSLGSGGLSLGSGGFSEQVIKTELPENKASKEPVVEQRRKIQIVTEKWVDGELVAEDVETSEEPF
uniref:keratin, type 1 cytoskeletal 11-like isoform X2 n=1 Tax=Myxine glutinosa TaxID=7769 RepID=UPI00358F2EAA